MSNGYHNHLRDERGSLRRTLHIIERALAGRTSHFHSIVVTGLSGIVPASAYCARHRKRLIIVRKKNEKSHGRSVESYPNWQQRPYIILDDFVWDGETLKRLLLVAPSPRYLVLYASSKTPEGFTRLDSHLYSPEATS